MFSTVMYANGSLAYATGSLDARASIPVDAVGDGCQMPKAPAPDRTRSPSAEKRPIDRTLTIYYATNRAADDSSIRTNYTGVRTDKLAFGIMKVRVPNNHLRGKVEYEPLTNIQIGRDYMKDNFVIRGIMPFERGEFIDILRSDTRDTALVFVHGYRNSFDDGAFRLAQIVWDGQLYKLIPLLFSWPSKNETTEYPYDVESAEISVEYFIDLLELLQKQAGIKTVHIIAHSMGNRIVLYAIKQAVDASKSRPLGEVVLAAADVPRQRFIQVINAVRKCSRGMTLYASADDAALWWSAKVNSDSSSRAGTVTKDGPFVVEGVESIDLTSTNPMRPFLERLWRKDPLGLNTHDTFVNPVIDDIALLVKNGQHPPPLRTASIRGVPEETPRYWRYAK